MYVFNEVHIIEISVVINAKDHSHVENINDGRNNVNILLDIQSWQKMYNNKDQ